VGKKEIRIYGAEMLKVTAAVSVIGLVSPHWVAISTWWDFMVAVIGIAVSYSWFIYLLSMNFRRELHQALQHWRQ
jgi:hypothetical protein